MSLTSHRVLCGCNRMWAGHEGDGNFHFVFLVDPDSEEEKRIVEYLYHRLIERALAMGGTSSGEHGIGLGKGNYFPKEFGYTGVSLKPEPSPLKAVGYSTKNDDNNLE